MKMLRAWLSRIGALFGKFERDRELDAELRSHLELHMADNLRAGMDPTEARRQALIRLGGLEQTKENCRDRRGLPLIETVLADLRFAARTLRKNSGFTAIAVLTLALGIGANTAIFSIVNAVFLRPLPFPHANRIFLVRRAGNEFGGPSISMPVFLAWQAEAGIFEHLGLVHWRLDASLTGAGESERIPSELISSGFLAALGIEPVMGRNFRPDEGRPGGHHAVLISDELWRNRFRTDPNTIGRELTLDGEGYAVVGILPPGLDLPIPGAHGAQIFFPLQVPLTSEDPANSGMLAIGLLKRGVTPDEAAAKLTPPLEGLRARFPKMFVAGERAQLMPLRAMVSDSAGPAPLLLFGAVGLVLLIACANVANMSLARSATRQREIAIRAAIGAGRRRIARQLLTESVLLALLGGILGVIVCFASFHLILGLVPTEEAMPHIGAYRIDTTVLGFALLLSLATGILFGFTPAVSASRIDLNASLQEGGWRSTSGPRGRSRQILAIAEIGVSLILLIGAALALQSFASLVHVQPGFDASNVTTAEFSLSAKQYDTPAKRIAFIDAGIRRLAALPGAENAAMINTLPLREGGDTLIKIEGRPDNPNEILGALICGVSPELIRTLRIPLVRGRGFSDADNADSPPVLIINEAMARAYWPKGDALGAHVWIGRPLGPKWAEPSAREVVGIVADIHQSSLAEAPLPAMYLPVAQTRHADWGYLLVRSARAGAVTPSEIRDALLKLDANNPPSRISTMQQTVSSSLTDWRFRAILLGIFAALALVIATIGVYGVISCGVAQRTHEIGIRVALGAERGDVLGLIIVQGARLAIVGVVLGTLATIGLAYAMANVLYGIKHEQPALLYGVKATDPVTFAATSLLLVLATVLACYLPARQAMRVDPLVALRYE